MQIKENEALKGYDVFEPYANCAYEKTTPFNHVSCALTIDGFAVRRMKPEPFSPDHCVDRIDLVRCHASKTVYELNKPLAERKVDECPGYSNGILNEWWMAYWNVVEKQQLTYNQHTIVWLAYGILNLFLERVVFNCRHFTAGTMECVKDVETTELGWPTKAALCISSLRTVVKLGQKCD
ncbi:unnamed protein product [Toxocara canis]|uniref:Uncharacterized protein n=1 Tax=Toxocara canis TaxID=6265 RepID=A0A3P7GX89_TOXCA|nr:unnamed protein product [Toxocara canis]